MFRLISKTRQVCPARPRMGHLAAHGAAAILFAFTLWGAPQAGAPSSSDQAHAAEQPKPPEADAKPAERAGSQTCQACHEDIYNAFQKTPHQTVEIEKKRGWAGFACESCHGLGSNHAESTEAAQIT